MNTGFVKGVDKLKEAKPLIHCITSPIAIYDCANLLLAIGVSPIMAEHPNEVADITAMSKGLSVSLANITDARAESIGISLKTAKENNISLCKGNTVCTDCFDVYMTDVNKFLERIPKNFNPLGAEMEAFALFYNAKLLNKKAACLMSVVDSKYIDKIATTEERQTGLNNMIKLSLESALKI